MIGAWGSVNERLPKVGQICLAYMTYYKEYILAEYDGDGEWLDRADLANVTRLVTHWATLPKPPITDD